MAKKKKGIFFFYKYRLFLFSQTTPHFTTWYFQVNCCFLLLSNDGCKVPHSVLGFFSVHLHWKKVFIEYTHFYFVEWLSSSSIVDFKNGSRSRWFYFHATTTWRKKIEENSISVFCSVEWHRRCRPLIYFGTNHNKSHISQYWFKNLAFSRMPLIFVLCKAAGAIVPCEMPARKWAREPNILHHSWHYA